MLKSIANRIANNFTDEDTRIITILDYATPGRLTSNLDHTDNSQNLIVLIDNATIMGSVNMQIYKSQQLAPMLDMNSPLPSDFNMTNAAEQIKNDQIKLAEIVNRLNNMDDSKTLYAHYPSFESYTGSADLEIKKDPKLTQIVPKDGALNDFLIPGGKSFLLVVEKGNDFLIQINRGSHIAKLCKPAVNAAKADCPSPSPDCDGEYSGYAFWIMFVILFIIIIVLAVVLGIYVFGDDGSESKISKVETRGSPTSEIELGSVTSPLEPVETK
jgi:hypothetical protein